MPGVGAFELVVQNLIECNNESKNWAKIMKYRVIMDGKQLCFFQNVIIYYILLYIIYYILPGNHHR